METNVVYHLDFLRNKLPDHCANLIIADPPYFEVKGDFDFTFDDFQHYLQHVERWGQECARILAENGTLIWWGDYRRIAYAQIILDKYFNLLTNGVWLKINGQTMRNKWEDARCLVNNTERFLVYETKSKHGENRSFYSPNAGDFFEGYEPLRQWLRAEYKSLGGVGQIIKRTKNNFYSHHTSRSQWSFPNPKNVEELLPLYAAKGIDIEKKRAEYESTRKEYEKQRAEYEKQRAEYEKQRAEYRAKRRPHFGELYKMRSVIPFDQESHLTRAYDFPTKKPPTLTRQLIETMSREGGLVVVPFAGSGTECAEAKRVGRNFIAYDIDARAVKMATDRAAAVQHEPKLAI